MLSHLLVLSVTWNAKDLIAGNLNDIWTGGKRVFLSRYLRMEKEKGEVPVLYMKGKEGLKVIMYTYIRYRGEILSTT